MGKHRRALAGCTGKPWRARRREGAQLSPGSQIREMRFAQVELMFNPATRLVLQLTVAIKIVD
jgi:hypothetical protein